MLNKIHIFLKEKHRYTILLLIGLLILVTLYFYTFFKRGIAFDNTFLEKSDINNGVMYSGRNTHGFLQITVLEQDTPNTKKIIYDLPEDLHFEYYITTVSDDPLENDRYQIRDNYNELLFYGYYDNEHGILYTSDNQIYVQTQYRYSYDSSPYAYSGYEPYYGVLISIVNGELESILGNLHLLILIILAIIGLVIDIRYPDFYFLLKYGHIVKEREHDDDYLRLKLLGRILISMAILVMIVLSISKWFR